MKLKVISDGTKLGTRVVNAETGELVKGVFGVQWEHKVHDLPTVILKIRSVPVEVTADWVEGAETEQTS
jgi:hypothetical protein